MIGLTLAIIVGLWLFFSRTLLGKALIATAVNRLGARLMGIAPALAGRLSFSVAAFIGALSGVLIAPLTTVYYDTGFLIGLKGFVAAIIGGLASYRPPPPRRSSSASSNPSPRSRPAPSRR